MYSLVHFYVTGLFFLYPWEQCWVRREYLQVNSPVELYELLLLAENRLRNFLLLGPLPPPLDSSSSEVVADETLDCLQTRATATTSLLLFTSSSLLFFRSSSFLLFASSSSFFLFFSSCLCFSSSFLLSWNRKQHGDSCFSYSSGVPQGFVFGPLFFYLPLV